MKTHHLIFSLIISLFSINKSYAQSPVDSVGSGCALKFNGLNNYIDCNNILYLGNTDLIATISFWVKGYGYVITTERSSFSWNCGDGGIRVNSNGTITYYSDHTIYAPYVSSTTTTTAIDTSQWNHIVIVIKGPSDTYDFYINGIKETKTLSFSMVNASSFTNIEIGRRRNYTWGTWFFNGQIDEVRIWNYARTEAEIRRDMCRRLTGTEPGLVGYWRFDDCGGNIAIDSSPNGNNGTLY